MVKHQRRPSGAPGRSEDSLQGQSPRGPSEAPYVGRTHFEEVRSTYEYPLQKLNTLSG